MKRWIPILMMFAGAFSGVASTHSSVAVAAPRTSPLPGAVSKKSATVANLVAAVHQKAAASAAAQKPTKRTSPSGILLFDSGDSAEVGLLRNVYGTLALADHDYKGHRRHAMKEVAAAAKLLGAHFHGDGKAGEKQAVSDAQLRNAQGMLSQAGAAPAAKAIAGVGKHIGSAINHLGIALTIK